MILIQRNAVPLFILLAVLAVSIGVLTVGVPFASGEEPEGCDTTTVGISVITEDNEGNPIFVVSQRDVINYTVTLSIPELPNEKVACNYGGGSLTITLPSGETVNIAGTEDTDEIPVVSKGNGFTVGPQSYEVDQNDTIKRNPVDGDSLELAARISYTNGQSYSLPGSSEAQEVSGSSTSTLRMRQPAISVEFSPLGNTGSDTQVVHQGQTAWFQIVVTNTGGFDLHGLAISSAEASSCDRPSNPTGAPFPVLPIQEKTEAYTCQFTPDTALPDNTVIAIEAKATASGKAKNHLGEPLDLVVANRDTTEVVFDKLALGISITPDIQIIREGDEAEFNISATTPSVTDMNDVKIRVVSTDKRLNTDEITVCDRNLGTIAAADEVQSYSCSYRLRQGPNQLIATITGTIPESEGVQLEAGFQLEAEDIANVQVITPGLNIVASSQATVVEGVPTVRIGHTSPISVVVTNTGDSSLSNVSVNSKVGYAGVQNCDHDLNDLGTLDADDARTIKCQSNNLEETSYFVFTVAGIAEDGKEESNESEPITVDVLAPSTAISVDSPAHPTVVVRMVVQTMTITETNDGDSPLRDVRVELNSNGIVPLNREPLTRDSLEYVGGDLNDDWVLDIGETWEWRVVTVAVAGDVVFLSGDSRSLELTATGFGIDQLNGEVTYPGDVDETGTLIVPISSP